MTNLSQKKKKELKQADNKQRIDVIREVASNKSIKGKFIDILLLQKV